MKMKSVQLKSAAIQYDGRRTDLPEGWHLVQPEVTWSAGREFIYFTYGNLLGMHGHWMGTAMLDAKPDNEGFEAYLEITRKADGRTYWRKALSFTFWDVKSEDQVARHNGAPFVCSPVYVDPDDERMVDLLKDFILLEKWQERAPELAESVFGLNMVEFREVNGGYGRGYIPHYLRPGDWLVEGSRPGSTSQAQWHVVKDGEIKAA